MKGKPQPGRLKPISEEVIERYAASERNFIGSQLIDGSFRHRTGMWRLDSQLGLQQTN